MTSQSDRAMTSVERADYGYSRVRDRAYDAVMDLWRRRAAEGMTQAQLAEALGGDAGWLSRNLRGPGNWTLKTIGRLVEALDGEVEILVHGLEDPLPSRPNYHAYAEYGINAPSQITGSVRVDAAPIVWGTTAVPVDLQAIGAVLQKEHAPVQVTIGSGK